jgi:hypothetical protein
MRSFLLPVLLACALGACVYDDNTSTSDQQIDGLNGQSMNGKSLNGTGLGNALASVSFHNVKLGGKEMHDVWLEGSELVAIRHNHIYRGADLVGARFSGKSDTHKDVKLRVAEVVAPSASNDIWHYQIEFRSHGTWWPLCLADALTGDGLNGPFLNGESLNEAIANGDVVVYGAIPVDGTWNYKQGVPGGGSHIETANSFTFACPKIGAIGKCVEAGYEPWSNASDGEGLDDAHEACVRLMRADYCGDGTPHTVNGTLINIYDNLGVQADEESWGMEGEWDADGARCITDHVRAANPIACVDRLYDPDCGNPPAWDDGTLIVSELP